jgi:anhydro-N-acetylmuramic acid kinase
MSSKTPAKAQRRIYCALGLMTGTSMDGIDAAVLYTDGENLLDFGPVSYRPYRPEERKLLTQALKDAASLGKHYERTPALNLAEHMVTQAHYDCIETLMLDHPDLRPDLIGFHGQTVFHDPDRFLTVQLGDGEALSRKLALDVVSDFRLHDMEQKGQGAPLAPVYHLALARHSAIDLPVGVLNLGGVGNLTFLSEDHPLQAFDTGPASALIDDFMMEHLQKPYDEGGALAALGKVDEACLTSLMDHPYFAQKPPKSLDRNSFSSHPVTALSPVDAVATLTAFTACSVAAALKHLPALPRMLIVTGGGTSNATMLSMIAQHTGLNVTRAEQLGWSSSFIEAQAFAYMAVRSVLGLPITFPGTTGVLEPLTGGRLIMADHA